MVIQCKLQYYINVLKDTKWSNLHSNLKDIYASTQLLKGWGSHAMGFSILQYERLLIRLALKILRFQKNIILPAI
jgi:hypothetical protein